MRRGGLFALLLLAVALATPGPAAADDEAVCERQTGDAAITACTRLIASGRKTGHVLATVYARRGVAYDDKGDYDRAIADFNEAIRLDPKIAMFQANRGLSYSNKGDYERAITDYDQAIRL